MSPPTRVLRLDDMYGLSAQLKEKILKSEFRPDFLIGISAGGLIPLYYLIKELGIADVATIPAQSYERMEQKELRIGPVPELDLSDRSVLLVDDIADSGKTQKKVAEIVRAKMLPRELKTATFAIKSGVCKAPPDFYALDVFKDWVAFEWERREFPDLFK